MSILSDPMGHDPHDSITRWSQLVGPLLAPIVVGPPLHRRYAAMRFAHIELGRRASERPHQTERLFTSHLVDLVTSVLVTPVSDETAALLAQRQEQRAARNAKRAKPAERWRSRRAGLRATRPVVERPARSRQEARHRLGDGSGSGLADSAPRSGRDRGCRASRPVGDWSGRGVGGHDHR